jgi:hypothetical protein
MPKFELGCNPNAQRRHNRAGPYEPAHGRSGANSFTCSQSQSQLRGRAYRRGSRHRVCRCCFPGADACVRRGFFGRHAATPRHCRAVQPQPSLPNVLPPFRFVGTRCEREHRLLWPGPRIGTPMHSGENAATFISLEIDSLIDKLAVAELDVEIEKRSAARHFDVIRARRQVEHRGRALALHGAVHFDGRARGLRRDAQRAGSLAEFEEQVAVLGTLNTRG